MRRLRDLFVLTGLLASALSATHPQVSSILPRGGQRGTEVELQIRGRNLQTLQGLLLFREGIEVLEVKPGRSTGGSLRIRIAPDCPLGKHPVLVRTSYGLSELHLFFVGSMKEVQEKEPNNSPEQAQEVPLQRCINGAIPNEDSDFFKVKVRKGKRVNIEVQALRLGDREFDAWLCVRNGKGEVLAEVDDTIYGLSDPLCSLVPTADETWTIEVRESARGGGNQEFYRLHIGDFPRPLAVFPLAGAPGTEQPLEFLGDAGLQKGLVRFPETAGLQPLFLSDENKHSPTPMRLQVSGLASIGDDPAGNQPAKSGPWQLLGPFANPRDKRGRSTGHSLAQGPEKALNRAGSFAKAARFKGRDGEIAWQPRPELYDNRSHDLRRWIKKVEDSVVFLTKTIDCPSSRRIALVMSGNDTLKLWLNGKLVHDQSKADRARTDADARLLQLRKGSNRLLVKIANRSGSLGFACRILDPHRHKNARALVIPGAVDGRIRKAGERDLFAFTARRGERINFRVIARQSRSPLDPLAVIYSTHRRFYLGNDDTGGQLDSLLSFRAPADGEFILRLSDLLGDGSDAHVYRLEATPPRAASPSLSSSFPGIRNEWALTLPQGSRNAILVSARNHDRRAELQLALRGLPEGVTAEIPPFARNGSAVPVVLHAAADQALGGHLLAFDASAKKSPKKRTAMAYRQAVQVVEARNQRTFLSSLIERLPLAVTARQPFTLEAVPPKVPLIRSSPTRIHFKLKRAKGDSPSVRVRLLNLPPGVRANQVTLNGKTSEGSLYLNASSRAALGRHPLVLVASATQRGGTVTCSSKIFYLTVEAPRVEAKLGQVHGEPGAKLSLQLDLDWPGAKQLKPDAEVKTQWIGVPRGITLPSPVLKPDTRKLSLPVEFAKNAPPGRHRSFRLRLHVPGSGGTIYHDFRTGEIRVFRPRKTEPARKAKTKTASSKRASLKEGQR